MLPKGEFQVGLIVRAYDHGYVVIWNSDACSGVETDTSKYERIHRLCPTESDLAGQLAVYQVGVGNRSADWFTAFSKKQIDEMISAKIPLDAITDKEKASLTMGIIKEILRSSREDVPEDHVIILSGASEIAAFASDVDPEFSLAETNI